MKTLNKIIIAAAGISLIAASYFAANGLSRTIADEGETASILFDGVENSFVSREGTYTAYTTNNNTVDYTVFYSSNISAETNGANLHLQALDDEDNYFTMQFGHLKGIRELHVYTSNKIVINAIAYRYKSAESVGHTDTENVPTTFDYVFPIGDTVSDLWKLSITFKCGKNSSSTVIIAGLEIVYNIADCEALDY